MKKNIQNIWIAILLFFSFAMSAQVGIGNTNPQATLDITAAATTTSKDGILVPRITLAQLTAKGNTIYDATTNGAMIYVSDVTTGTIDQTGQRANISLVGYYYFDAVNDIWKSIGSVPAQIKFMYMPSISISTAATGTFTKNLYNEYKSQFFTPMTASTGAPISINYYALATDLYYYATYFDPTVFANVIIDANGLMTYDIISAASECSFINIVFVPKN